MKTMVAAGGLLLALGAGSAAPPPLTASERQRLVAHLQFRRAPGVWTIMEVLEHLVVAEPIYWENLQKAMKALPSSQKRAGTDADILWYGIDRTQRQKAVPAEEPKGRLHDLGTGLDAFRRLHAQMLQYARTTDDDLRGHVVEREGCDAYQWLLLISSHEQRHILQIREIKADPHFPKK
jgi:hypothetical protein